MLNSIRQKAKRSMPDFAVKIITALMILKKEIIDEFPTLSGRLTIEVDTADIYLSLEKGMYIFRFNPDCGVTGCYYATLYYNALSKSQFQELGTFDLNECIGLVDGYMHGSSDMHSFLEICYDVIEEGYHVQSLLEQTIKELERTIPEKVVPKTGRFLSFKDAVDGIAQDYVQK